MSTLSPLAAAFRQTEYPVGGHGRRNLDVLKEVINELDGTVESDIYGTGEGIEAFQAEMAAYLGKEKAVFFPSGTMAQQIALRIWCDEAGIRKVAYHPLSHLEIHEEDGLRELHQIQSILLGEKDRLIRLDEILELQEDIACLLLELPQREIGGELPPFEELVAISAHCRAKGIKLHLDGARLYEVLPYYQKTAADICALFDSVYISFYKGIGGIAGAILAGEEAFTAKSKVWKRRHGGDLISLYPYYLTAGHYFKQRVHKMPQYYEQAVELAALYNSCHLVTTLPRVPVTNMFHVRVALPKDKLEPILIALYEETGVGLSHFLREINEHTCGFEVSIGDCYARIPKNELKRALERLDASLQEVNWPM
ncbi:threonine aldolase family protein [Paenibacillus roseipurpureus]|uniref:Beta-eliminating lyase-related protein n=1 Tax=Paenibacillus roseopurpureus TaxID=2918901 RepID=A0AA96LJZ9_9BACL|nr:aminotransferase class I/II-fold pyridoxal phosphate-dependent enzyme [Paenibacillus sp. MBLB1832]WNR43140.1 beta-eliminating lyase-related protein [Paenibacillus sp. MBLB1832]